MMPQPVFSTGRGGLAAFASVYPAAALDGTADVDGRARADLAGLRTCGGGTRRCRGTRLGHASRTETGGGGLAPDFPGVPLDSEAVERTEARRAVGFRDSVSPSPAELAVVVGAAVAVESGDWLVKAFLCDCQNVVNQGREVGCASDRRAADGAIVGRRRWIWGEVSESKSSMIGYILCVPGRALLTSFLPGLGYNGGGGINGGAEGGKTKKNFGEGSSGVGEEPMRRRMRKMRNRKNKSQRPMASPATMKICKEGR
jgi:hypothetical protein